VNGSEEEKGGGNGSAVRIVASHDGQRARPPWTSGVRLILVAVGEPLL
jgi:hypothetical protein